MRLEAELAHAAAEQQVARAAEVGNFRIVCQVGVSGRLKVLKPAIDRISLPGCVVSWSATAQPGRASIRTPRSQARDRRAEVMVR
jgi:hypothetical protein